MAKYFLPSSLGVLCKVGWCCFDFSSFINYFSVYPSHNPCLTGVIIVKEYLAMIPERPTLLVWIQEPCFGSLSLLSVSIWTPHPFLVPINDGGEFMGDYSHVSAIDVVSVHVMCVVLVIIGTLVLIVWWL